MCTSQSWNADMRHSLHISLSQNTADHACFIV